MISERRLKKWRKEALLNKEAPEITYNNVREISLRILEMTQELMDLRLLRKLDREDQKVVAAEILYEKEEANDE